MSKYQDVWARVRIKLKSVYFLRLKPQNLTLSNSSYKANSLHKTDSFSTVNRAAENNNYKLPFLIMHPSMKIRVIWNTVMAIVLIYTAIIMPYTLTFLEYSSLDGWGIADLVLDGLFFIDILINFNSAYIDQEGQLITSRKVITLNYLKSWFWIDAVSCIPFSFIGSDSSPVYSQHDYNNFFRLMRLPRLYRLFRVVRLLKMFKHYRNNEIIEKIQELFSIKHSVMKLITSTLGIILCVHLMTCFWFYASKIEGFNPDTWVFRAGINTDDYESLYIVSLYWTITTLCTVGYGDIHAQTNLEKILSIGWMIFSVYFLSFVIGSLSSMLASMDTKENALVSKLAIIDEFAKEAKLSKDLKSRLRYALRYSTEKTGFSWSDKQNIFNELPKHLRYEVSMAMHHGAARHINFFTDKDQVVIAAIVPFLKPVFYSMNQFVYKKQEYAEEVYFIVRGRISYVLGKNHLLLTSMQRGNYFGDIEVMLQTNRKYSAKSERDSELLIMNKELIAQVMEEYPQIWESMKEAALKRNTANEKAIAELQELALLREKGALEKMDVKNFKNSVAKRLEKRENRNKLKRRSINLTNNASLSLKDLYTKLDSMCSTINLLEKEIETIQNPSQKFLKKMDNDSDSLSWQSSDESSED